MKNNKLYSILPISITAAVFIAGVAVGQFANLSSVFAQQAAPKTVQVGATAANTMVLNGAFMLQGANGNFDQSNSAGYFRTGTGIVSLNGDTAIASGKAFLTSTGSTTATGGKATLNQQAGVVTTDNLTGHDSSSYDITVNDSMITASSFILYNIVRGSDSTGTNCTAQNSLVTPSTSGGSFQVSIRFSGAGVCTNPNGTEKLNFVILNPQ